MSLPVPKKLATSVAQRGAVEAIAGSASVWLFDVLIRIVAIVGFRIGKRTGDDIAAACPFAQIDSPAALAAERKLRFALQHDLATDGTAQAAN